MMSINQSNGKHAHDVDNDTRRKKASWRNAAFFNSWDYRQQDILLGIASSSPFANMESLGPMQLSLQQESMARVLIPEDMIPEVLEEGLLIADTFALEPTPIDTSRMNIVCRLPLNLYSTQNISIFKAILSTKSDSNESRCFSPPVTSMQNMSKRQVVEQQDRLPLNLCNTKDISLIKETLSTKNNFEEPHRFSPPVTFMPCISYIRVSSSADASRKYSKHLLEGAVQQSMSKRQVEQHDEEEAQRLRPYQAELWTVKFAELLEFKQQRGHCCVPHNFEKSALARWVKRQRYQYKLKIEGKQSTMTDERVVVLEAHGFIWDYHGAVWQERRNELAEYKGMFGNCNVPSNYVSNPQLATWIKFQRTQYKLYFEGKATTRTTLERIADLKSLGFKWELRRSSKGK